MIEKDETAAGFLSDPGFREWALYPNQANSLYWENYLKAHPGEQEEMAWARQVVAAMQQPGHILPEEKVNRLWAGIEAEMQPPRQRKSPLAPETRVKWTAWVLALLTLGLGGLLLNNCRRNRLRP
ncbi:MAG: hypothetical protein ACO1O1_07885 [Adhaeribacter sp.]